MVKKQQNFFQGLSWLFMPEDSTIAAPGEHFCFAREKAAQIDESTKHRGWIKAVFWIVAAQMSALLISFL